MAVTIQQTPSTLFDQVYGPNPVTLAGIPTNPTTGVLLADKYVLQITRNGELIADLRQTPNRYGRAIFDIQNTLQNYVSPSDSRIERIGYQENPLKNSAREAVAYTLEAGYEDFSGVHIDTTQTGFIAFGGKKEYYEDQYPAIYNIPFLVPDGTCVNTLFQAEPFTDRKSFRLASSIQDGKPSILRTNDWIFDHYVTRIDMETISYYNDPTVQPGTLAQSIDAFVIYQYNGNVQLPTITIFNTQINGGGPNVTSGQGLIPAHPYKAITLGTGPRNISSLDPTCTHYYVATQAYAPDCNNDLIKRSMHNVHRYNIIEEDCNDFPEYQFSWLNSYGFRDYYSFRKRKDRSVNITRNTYLKEAADYNALNYSVNESARGTTVYSQKLEEIYTAFTNFISDEDALFLEGLFTSADVKVRFNDYVPSEWFPITLLDTSYIEKTVRKDKLFQYSIKFKKANNIKSQRG